MVVKINHCGDFGAILFDGPAKHHGDRLSKIDVFKQRPGRSDPRRRHGKNSQLVQRREGDARSVPTRLEQHHAIGARDRVERRQLRQSTVQQPCTMDEKMCRGSQEREKSHLSDSPARGCQLVARLGIGTCRSN